MSRSRAYRTTLLNNVKLDRILKGRDGQPVTVGCDISKDDIRVVLRWKQDDFERPWKVNNPRQIKQFVNMLQSIAKSRNLQLAMEPTGTYGDALRHQLQKAGIVTVRVSPRPLTTSPKSSTPSRRSMTEKTPRSSPNSTPSESQNPGPAASTPGNRNSPASSTRSKPTGASRPFTTETSRGSWPNTGPKPLAR